MPKVDIALFGATGFVGALTAAALADAAPPGCRVALAGRNAEKLDIVRGQIGAKANDWHLVIADATDPTSLDKLAASARVIITTVGPYSEHGLDLVRACAEAGTHYVDLTGEVPFMRRSIDTYHNVAYGTGAKIVHACGFDSIPSDLAAMLAAESAIRTETGPVTDITCHVRSVKGGMSGGTIASMAGVLESAKNDPAVAALVNDPYALSADRDSEPRFGPQKDVFVPYKDIDGQWAMPFIMASSNTRIVRRTHSLLDHAYGMGVRYREVMTTGTSPLSAVTAGALTGFLGGAFEAMSHRRARKLLNRFIPSPGAGPSDKALESGHFTFRTIAFTTGGARVDVTLAGDRDPGYALTAIMLSQSALCLAYDELPETGGVLTPATAMGRLLVARLVDHGLTVQVTTTTPKKRETPPGESDTAGAPTSSAEVVVIDVTDDAVNTETQTTIDVTDDAGDIEGATREAVAAAGAVPTRRRTLFGLRSPRRASEER